MSIIFPGLYFVLLMTANGPLNSQAVALLGYAPEELISATAFRHMIPKEDQEENRRSLSQISKENPHYELVYRIRTAPGKIKWVKEEGTGVYSTAGELVALDGFLVDITEQKTTEIELREENLRLKSSYFLKRFSDLGVTAKLPENAKSTLINYSWPGNVRELQNVISRFLTINKIELASNLVSRNKAKMNSQVGLTGNIEKMEKQAILDALKRNHWHIGKSAADLGFSRRTMQRRMIKYGLR